VSAGQAAECKELSGLLDSISIQRLRGRPRKRPRRLAGDKGYSHRFVRALLRVKGIGAVIPRRLDQLERGESGHFDRDAYARRNAIERTIGHLKECRRIATRYEKLAVSYLAMVSLAIIRRYFRLLEMSDKA
jgi:transposase